MLILRSITALAFVTILFLGLALDCAMSSQMPKSALKLSAERTEEDGLKLIRRFVPGSYLYKVKISVSGGDGPSGPPRLPHGEARGDPRLWPIEVIPTG